MPTPRPRYLSRITSPISTAPAAHSPPKPSPCNARNTKSCSKFWAKAQRKVKTEYHRIVICSIRTRPNRSASVPENHPPKDEISKVTVPITPASPQFNLNLPRYIDSQTPEDIQDIEGHLKGGIPIADVDASSTTGLSVRSSGRLCSRRSDPAI